MASNLAPKYRWLRIAGVAVLSLAALVLAFAWHRASEDRRNREDIGVRAQAMMNQLEAEAARMENAAQQP